MKVTLIIYTKNEVDGMRAIMPRIKKEWYDQLLVIDGASTDGTVEYCKEHGYEVHQQELPLWGGAYMEGHKRATGDVIVDFSPDGNSVPEVIPELVAKMREGYDLVVASRYFGGAKSEDDSALTGFGNWMFTFIINVLFGGNYTDTLVIFRAYKKSLLAECGLDRHVEHAFTPQICIRAAKLKKRTCDVPGDEPARIGGESKLRIFYCGMLVLGIIWKELVHWRVPVSSRPAW